MPPRASLHAPVAFAPTTPMIAAAGYHLLRAGRTSDLDLNATANLELRA